MNWPTPKVGDVTLAIGQCDPAALGIDSFRYIDIASIDRERKEIIDAGIVRTDSAPSRARKLVRTGDVLVSTVRPNLNAVAQVPADLDGQIASTGFSVLRADPKYLEPRYLFYRSLHPEFVDYLVANATGASYPAVSDAVIRRAPLPLPTLKEQGRIIELLDEAANLRELRREADEKASRILPSLFLKMFGVPESWEQGDGIVTASLGELVRIQSGGTPSKAIDDYWIGDVPWVSPKDMKCDFIDDAEDHISERAVEASATRMIEAQSILVVVRGMILARHVPLAMTLRPVTINQDIKALTIKDNRITPLFLLAALKTLAPRLFADVSTAAHGTKKLETSKLAMFPIPIPSTLRISQVTKMYEELKSFDLIRADAGTRIDSLFSLLVGRAFSGQLTAQWRHGHMKELLTEMAEQSRLLNLPAPQALAS